MTFALAAGGFFAARNSPGRPFPGIAGVAVAAGVLAAFPLAVHFGRPIPPDESLLGPVRSAAAVPRIITPLPAAWGPAWLDSWDRVEWAEARMGIPSHGIQSRVANVGHLAGVLPLRYVAVATAFRDRFGPSAPVAWRRLGATHVVLDRLGAPSFEGKTAVDGGWEVVRDDRWGASVWAVPHRPWASFAPGVMLAATRPAALGALLRSLETGSEDVVVETTSTPPTAPGRVHAVERESERIRVVAESDGPSLLVVNDAWSPGWKATIDGDPVEVLPADVIARAVRWPHGRHVLEMRYDPEPVRRGLWASALGAFALALSLVVPAAGGAWRRRYPAP